MFEIYLSDAAALLYYKATSQSYVGGSVEELHFFRRKKKNSTSPGHKLNATAQDEKQKAVCPSSNGLPGQAAIWHDPTENCLVLVGGFNPLETVKHISPNSIISPGRDENTTYLSCHHLVVYKP